MGELELGIGNWEFLKVFNLNFLKEIIARNRHNKINPIILKKEL